MLRESTRNQIYLLDTLWANGRIWKMERLWKKSHSWGLLAVAGLRNKNLMRRRWRMLVEPCCANVITICKILCNPCILLLVVFCFLNPSNQCRIQFQQRLLCNLTFILLLGIAFIFVKISQIFFLSPCRRRQTGINMQNKDASFLLRRPFILCLLTLQRSIWFGSWHVHYKVRCFWIFLSLSLRLEKF